MITRVKIAPGQNTYSLNAAAWRNGTYILSLWNGEKQINSENLVISH
jgi:hypothetical protein